MISWLLIISIGTGFMLMLFVFKAARECAPPPDNKNSIPVGKLKNLLK